MLRFWFALAALVTGSLSVSVSVQEGTATGRVLTFAAKPDPAEPDGPDPAEPDGPDPAKPDDKKFEWTCPNRPHTPASSKPRVRKEWRELSKADIDKYRDALEVMDNIKTEEGRECYGRQYWNFADLVMLHGCAAADQRGDQGHRAPSFMLFHRAYVLTFEEAILSVDPSIGAIPWWDMAADTAPGANPKHPEGGKYYNTADYIWTDKYFGQRYGDPTKSYAIKDGRWAGRKMPLWGDFDVGYWKKATNKSNVCIARRYLAPVAAHCEPGFNNASQDFNLGGFLAPVEDNVCQECPVDNGGNYPVYMRGPTLDVKSCSPYVTRNPTGWGARPDAIPNAAGQCRGDKPDWDGTMCNGCNCNEIPYVQADFDACTDAENNARTWMEWQNCQEEDVSGTLKGVYMDSEGNVHRPTALHSTAHDKVLGEMGDVTTSPADPVLFFSYHAYVDKNHHEWMKNMEKMDPDAAENYYYYPKNIDTAKYEQAVEVLKQVPFIQGLVAASQERMTKHGYPKPVLFENFDLMLWQDLIASSNQTWNKAARLTKPDVEEIRAVTKSFRDDLTHGSRTVATSGPWAYLTLYQTIAGGEDFFNRGKTIDVATPWVPGTMLKDVNDGGFPFRYLFAGNAGGPHGYGNYELIKHTRPCTPERSPLAALEDEPCAPYTFSDGADCEHSACSAEWLQAQLQ